MWSFNDSFNVCQFQQQHQQQLMNEIFGPLSTSKMSVTIELKLCSLLNTAGIQQLNNPQGFALGLNNELVIADSNNHRCVVVNFEGRLLRQLGCPGMDDGQLLFPRKVHNDNNL